MLPGKGSLEGDPAHSLPTTHPHHCLDSQLPGFRLDVDMVQDTGLSEETACLRLFQEGSAHRIVPTANISWIELAGIGRLQGYCLVMTAPPTCCSGWSLGPATSRRYTSQCMLKAQHVPEAGHNIMSLIEALSRSPRVSSAR